ncbi:hypothetical protein [Flavobacterium sp.]|uniref:hypothetical protein n=1 Tax=Flavobacterium sp. TaxID=239 RepID=UPI003D13812F
MTSTKKLILTFLSIGLIILLIIVGFIIWWKLPVSINRHNDIKFGNKIINSIEHYREKNRLPETNEWNKLIELGFKQRGDLLIPDYQKLNDTAYQLVYLESFDGPYLNWNSFDKEWKNSMLTHFKDNHTEEDIVSLIEQSKLYLDKEKLIDSLSNGKRNLSLSVSLDDTIKNIYIVKVFEDNGSNLVTHFNILVDANKMKILNPTGKLEGQ